MPRPPRRSLAFVVIAMTSLVWPLRATPPSTDTYPARRWPGYLVNPSPDRMLQAARIAVRQPYGMSPLGKMQSGQKVHVFLEYTQNPLVWDAIRQAWAERGVEAAAIQGWGQVGMTKAQYGEPLRVFVQLDVVRKL